MDPAASAVMVLLSCSPEPASVCRPIDMAPTIYASADECQASLMERLAKSPDGEIIGRCREIDPTVTGSLLAGHTTVIVARGVGVVTSYIVPKAD